jgi:hypothetical protein
MKMALPSCTATSNGIGDSLQGFVGVFLKTAAMLLSEMA